MRCFDVQPKNKPKRHHTSRASGDMLSRRDALPTSRANSAALLAGAGTSRGPRRDWLRTYASIRFYWLLLLLNDVINIYRERVVLMSMMVLVCLPIEPNSFRLVLYILFFAPLENKQNDPSI
jgi:hypothetical protein